MQEAEQEAPPDEPPAVTNIELRSLAYPYLAVERRPRSSRGERAGPSGTPIDSDATKPAKYVTCRKSRTAQGRSKPQPTACSIKTKRRSIGTVNKLPKGTLAKSDGIARVNRPKDWPPIGNNSIR